MVFNHEQDQTTEPPKKGFEPYALLVNSSGVLFAVYTPEQFDDALSRGYLLENGPVTSPIKPSVYTPKIG